ncbi:MAG: heat shock protein HspQ [Magnetospiraceae bacterium]
MPDSLQAKFAIGQLIHHRLFDYRGVVVDVDPHFCGTEGWYQSVARSQPPKDRPWYHVLVDGSDMQTYVAERNLEADTETGPVRHPLVRQVFEKLEAGAYVARRRDH